MLRALLRSLRALLAPAGARREAFAGELGDEDDDVFAELRRSVG